MAIEARASQSEEFTLNIRIENKLTHRVAISLCELLEYKADSTVAVVRTIRYFGGEIDILFEKRPPKGQYKLCITPGHIVEKSDDFSRWTDIEPDDDVAPTIVDIDLPDDATSPYKVPTIYISSRKSTALKEVSVTASKVMFYNRGDTLIYNADAFVLAEGSMLDALLDQMPGVELKPDGQIFVNGQKIDNLLLNGKDLFNGKRELMLENLEAYTVKDVAIYKKRNRLGELLDYNTGGEPRVMDVRLKRQYITGFLGNATAGYGTHSRYMTKLFGMLLSDNFSASAYAGANNLSDKKNPGREDDSWTTDNMGEGVKSSHKAGVSYNAQGFAGKWELKGNAEVERECADIIQNYNTETLDKLGNSFNYNRSDKMTRDWNINTSHEFFIKLGSWGNLNIRPSFKYSKSKSKESFASAMFRNKVDEIHNDSLNDYIDSVSDSLPDLMNRSKKDYSSGGHEISASFGVSSNIKLHRGANPNALNIEANVDYDNSRNNMTDKYQTYYHSYGVDIDNNYLKREPNNNYKLDLKSEFFQFFNFKQIQLPVTYRYIEDHKDNKSNIFAMPGSDISMIYDDPVGLNDNNSAWLPDLSYHAISETRDHILQLNPMTGQLLNSRTHYLMFILDANLTFRRNTLNFLSSQGREHYTRDHIIPYIELHTQWGNPENWDYTLNMRYRIEPINIINLVDIPTTDPLVHRLGNRNLKNSDIYHFYFSAKHYKNQPRQSISLDVDYHKKPIEFAYQIDSNTGHTSFYPINATDRLDSKISYYFFTRFGQLQQFDISNNTNLSYSKNSGGSVGRISRAGGKESINLNWRKDKYRIGIFADAEVSRFLYSDKIYNNFTTYSIRYGTTAALNLPYSWSISTALSIYTRGGYYVDDLNRTDVVWNARISKSIMNGRLIFAVDGYDLLHQLSNVEYKVSSQTRSEIVSNVIPSYVLFHISWRFNKKLKK